MNEKVLAVPTATFTKAQRLLTPSAFKAVFDAPEGKLHQKHFMAFIRSNECKSARIGMAITKRKVPTAVARNAIKRQIRENFRIQCSELKNKDIVFIIKISTKNLSNKEIKNQINNIFNKLKK